MAEPLQSAKIPEVVDLKDADPERKAMYTEPAKVFTEERRKLMSENDSKPTMFLPGQTEAAAPPPPEEEPLKAKEIEVSEDDKRAFIRSILADRTFEKVYSLFGGQVEATFVDRTADETDRVLDRLNKLALADEAVDAEADVLSLCSTLRELKRPDGRNGFPITDDYSARRAELRKLPRPLYEALLETSRDFEALINQLINKARSSDFWPAGGGASPLKRTAGAR